MNCATTNAFFANEKLLFRNGIMIHSGRDVFHKQIVWVIDTVKSAGFDRIGFAITAREWQSNLTRHAVNLRR